MKTITMAAMRQHARKCKKMRVRFDWLGFVENKTLTPEVEALFTSYDYSGHPIYDWVHGNEKLVELEQEA